MFGTSSNIINNKVITNDKEKLEEMINKYDKDMLIRLGQLYTSLTGEKLDLNNTANIIDGLLKYNTKSEYNYLNNLLFPEKCKNVKIPSPIPVPSCSFQLHNCVTLTPNAQGNIAILFNPYYLVNENFIMSQNSANGSVNGAITANGGYIGNDSSIATDGQYYFSPCMTSSLLVNNDPTLNGTESNNHFIPININQVIPDVYDQYRLVSASLVIKYIGRLDIVSGVIGGAIVFDEQPSFTGAIRGISGDGTSKVLEQLETAIPGYTDTSTYAKYGNFDLAMDSFYHQENNCLEGIRMLYFPIDNSYEEYCKLIGIDSINNIAVNNVSSLTTEINLDPDNFKSGFKFFIYTLGAPNNTCLKLDIYCNYECLPNAKFLNYMPTSVSTYGLNSKEKKEILDIVQTKPIMRSGEILDIKSPDVLGFKEYMRDMAKRFKNGLPGAQKLLGMGLEYLIPKLKPAMSLVGTMINTQNQNSINEPMNIENNENK